MKTNVITSLIIVFVVIGALYVLTVKFTSKETDISTSPTGTYQLDFDCRPNTDDCGSFLQNMNTGERFFSIGEKVKLWSSDESFYVAYGTSGEMDAVPRMYLISTTPDAQGILASSEITSGITWGVGKIYRITDVFLDGDSVFFTATSVFRMGDMKFDGQDVEQYNLTTKELTKIEETIFPFTRSRSEQ